MTSSDTTFALPVPHVYRDGSINDIAIQKWANSDFMTIRDGVDSLIISDSSHARRIAEVLVIAADLIEMDLKGTDHACNR